MKYAHWCASVQDYIDRNDSINLYIAAQHLNSLAPRDPLGLYGMEKAQRHRADLESAYFNVTQARQFFTEPVEGIMVLEAQLAQELGQHDAAANLYAELVALTR